MWCPVGQRPQPFTDDALDDQTVHGDRHIGLVGKDFSTLTERKSLGVFKGENGSTTREGEDGIDIEVAVGRLVPLSDLLAVFRHGHIILNKELLEDRLHPRRL